MKRRFSANGFTTGWQLTQPYRYAFETVASLTILFLAFGLGLDPRNSTTFGPALAPFLIGFATAVVLFAGGIARKGYLGPCKQLTSVEVKDLCKTHHCKKLAIPRGALD